MSSRMNPEERGKVNFVVIRGKHHAKLDGYFGIAEVISSDPEVLQHQAG